MIYQFKSGHTHHGVDAQVAGEELEKIRLSHNGKLKPEDILKSAKSQRSPLYNIFTWDDAKAAHQHRLSEARSFVRSLVVVYANREEPAFWNIIVSAAKPDDSAERYYQSSSVIASSPIEYEAALRVVLIELSSAQSGLEKLQTLAPKGSKMKIHRASKFLESAADALE